MLVYGGKKFKGIGITNGIGLDTSDADITPPDMQKGKTAYVNGKKIIGTGKAFSFAEYGRAFLDIVIDENGNEKFGFQVETKSDANVVFFSTTANGDILTQNKIFLTYKTENKAEQVGVNISTQGGVYFLKQDNYINIYIEDVQNSDTFINYFVAKDEMI